jgi:hypothetical protein
MCTMLLPQARRPCTYNVGTRTIYINSISKRLMPDSAQLVCRQMTLVALRSNLCGIELYRQNEDPLRRCHFHRSPVPAYVLDEQSKN